MNIAHTIENLLSTEPAEKLFLSTDGDELTIGDFIEKTNNRRQWLIENGVKPNDKLIIVNGRGTNYWIDMLSAWGMGAIIIPVDHLASVNHIETITATTNPVMMLGKCLHYTADADAPLNLLNSNGGLSKQPNSHDQLAAILFTSGSTGQPKGVMLTHQAIINNVQQTLRRLDFKKTDRLFIATGFHFTSAICHFLATAFSAASMIATEKKLLPADLSNAIIESKATCFGGSPIQLRWIADTIHELDLNITLNWLFSSGDHLAPEIARKLYQLMPNATVYVAYGLTEVAGRLCIFRSNKDCPYIKSVGKPIDGMKISIRDENASILPAEQLGDVYVTGPSIFLGYYKMEMAIDNQLGFKTGDTGYLDKDGQLFLSGRSDCVFKCAGQKVSTLPITDALSSLNIFTDVFVIAIEHPVMGHIPWVFYTLMPHHTFDTGEVIKLLRQRLPLNHIPRNFTEVQEVPRTRAGKPNFKQLKNMVTQD